MRIAVLGAGVGGVSAAIALRQKGFDVEVYERTPAPKSIGAGIVAWPNATFVLEKLGVLPSIERVAGRPSTMRRRSRAGEELGGVDLEAIERAMGAPSFSILRSDLQDILVERLASLGTLVRFDSPIVSIDEGASGARVRLENGNFIEADLFLGADGRMRSIARAFVHGENTPKYQGFVNWIGVFEAERDLFSSLEIGDFWGVGTRFGIVPVTTRKAYWAGGAAEPLNESRDPSRYKRELRELFEGWPEPIAEVIERTSLERIHKIYVHDHDPIRVWHRRNLLLLGDAAHAALPTSGQGACQALEDAWHFARALEESAGDPERAFSRFTALRFEKTTGIQRSGRALAASLFNRDPAFCAARNEASRKTDFAALASGMASGWSAGLSD